MNRLKWLRYVLVGALLLIGRSSEKAIADEDCTFGGQHNCGCGCWWRLDEGTPGGPGHWVCEPSVDADWCDSGGGECSDGTGGCVLL